MITHFIFPRTLLLGSLCLCLAAFFMPQASAQDAAPAITQQTIADFDKVLASALAEKSEARQRLAVRRVIRDAQQAVETHKNDPSRFLALEFLFRAHQRLIALDDDAAHRQNMLEICRELVKAPDNLAQLRLEADLLLSQADLAKQGANAEARAQALRPFVERYIETPVGSKVLRMAMVMALELGDSRLVTDLHEMSCKRFAGDLEMITFQREKLGGQVFGAPFVGTFERSDGKMVCMPMDAIGRSTMLLFWTKEKEGSVKYIKGIAAAALEMKQELAGRLEIISFNLDDLPDAGESILRGFGVDWQTLRLPGGKKHPIYDAFVRSETQVLTMSPTGYAALVMSGTNRNTGQAVVEPDYKRMLTSSLARRWTDPRYAAQLSSLMAGDFLALDPEGGIDPAKPPELKVLSKGEIAKPLDRGAASVPAETLRAIQDSFVPSPQRYRLSLAEARESYTKAAALCRKAIADHPKAPDLWIVRNRLVTALLGLWKTDADLKSFDAAVQEAKTALDAGYPEGCDLIARFCLARAALRDPSANPGEIIDRLIAENGGDSAPGPVLAAAALLSLDAADRGRFERYREAIFKGHTEYPMMWTFSAFLLDRHHDYWLFQVPFSAGWSYGRREGYFFSKGDTETANRLLKTELRTLEGEPMRIPQDLDSQWTIIVFPRSGPWQKKIDDGLPPSPQRMLKSHLDFAATRPEKDVKVLMAMLDGDADSIRAALLDSKITCPTLTVPGGVTNPLINRLGILSEDNKINSLLLGKDGRIAVMISGLTNERNENSAYINNAIVSQDEKAITSALERGEIEAAKARILALAPPYDPNAVDERGRKRPKPTYNLAHLRARARVYMALKDYDNALADAEEVVQRQTGSDGGMSLRTEDLDVSEALRDTIRQQMKTQE